MIDLTTICDCCGGAQQDILQLFNDLCFKIISGSSTSDDFCMNDFAFPVDGNTCVRTNVDANGGEITIFDNGLDQHSPSSTLASGQLYARGILLKVIYPTSDANGETIDITTKNSVLTIQNGSTLTDVEYPLYNFFAMFTNPKSNQTSQVINKIKISNPSSSFKIRVVALVLLGQAN